MKKIISTLAILLIATGVYAQDFVTINPNPRTSSMGNATVAVSGDAYSIFGNAAAPLFEYHSVQVQASYTPWQSDAASGYYLLSLGGYVKIGQKHALSIGGRWFQEPKLAGLEAGMDGYPFIPKDEEGNIISLDITRPNGKSLDLAYAYKVCERLGLAVTARYLHYSNGIGDKSDAVDFDIAAYSSIPLSMLEGSSLEIGAQVANLGFAFGETKYTQPITAKAGVSLFAPFSDSHSLLATVNAGYRCNSVEMKGFIANAGLEYSLMQLLKVRAGYAYDIYNYATVGLGIRFMHIQVDASYWVAGKSCPWRNTFSVGLGVDF